MTYQPASFATAIPDREALHAMRATLREFRAVIAKPVTTADHPLRSEMLDVLADARARIDRINAAG